MTPRSFSVSVALETESSPHPGSWGWAAMVSPAWSVTILHLRGRNDWFGLGIKGNLVVALRRVDESVADNVKASIGDETEAPREVP